MFNNLIFLILKGIRHRPMRSWLTILGVIIGVMLVVFILSLGDGIRGAVSKTLQMFGSDIIVVFPGKETNPFSSLLGGQRFRLEDAKNLENIEGVRIVSMEDVGTLNVEFGGEKKSVLIHADPPKAMAALFEESQGLKLTEGRWPTGDRAAEVVLGDLAANNLFKKHIRVGDEIVVRSKRMRVVGVMSPIGNQMSDNLIFMPITLFHELAAVKPGATSINVKVDSAADINLIAKQIRFQLSKQEAVREFSVLTPEKANRLVGDILSLIELALIFIALISLVVGAVGIMNTMYTSVLERIKQIGIMKAVGASNEAILSLFLLESGIIGLVGGLIGIFLGVFLAFVVGLVIAGFGIRGLFSFASLDYLGLLVVLAITFITGVISGILPARQAARLEPAEALRYE